MSMAKQKDRLVIIMFFSSLFIGLPFSIAAYKGFVFLCYLLNPRDMLNPPLEWAIPLGIVYFLAVGVLLVWLTTPLNDKLISDYHAGKLTMPTRRESMVMALHKSVIWEMRQRGFKGSFPHFRRVSETQIDLLTFQFDKWCGGFVIEIAQCPPGGITTQWGKRIDPQKVKAVDLHPNGRHRLHPHTGSPRDDCFRCDKSQDKTVVVGDIFDLTAQSVLPFLDRAEEWWEKSERAR